MIESIRVIRYLNYLKLKLKLFCVMSFRKTVSWVFFPLTMWYAVGVWLRNMMFNIGLKRQMAPSVTTIGVGNLCAGGAGKTPHVEYLLRLLSADSSAALLSRGYRRKGKGFYADDGTHSAVKLGDEPAMVARKMENVTVAVCEKRVTGVRKLMQRENPPQVVVLDDVFQHRYIKPTVNILLTEYGKPYFKDHIMPFGDLREPRSARFRANIVVVTKSPEKLNPIDKHNMINELDLKPYQKVFFSYIHYCDPVPLMGGHAVPLDTLDGVLAVTGIANPEQMLKHVEQYCPVTSMRYGDHHNFSHSDLKHIRKAFEQLKGDRKVILTTEKDAERLRTYMGDALAGLPIYCLPIEVRMHQTDEYNFDQTIHNIVHDNILFQERMKNTSFNRLED